MFRVDKALSKHLALTREKSRARREQAQALEHFRSRAVGLLEMAASRRPAPAAALVEAAPALLSTLGRATTGGRASAGGVGGGSGTAQAQLTALGARVAGLLKRLPRAEVPRGEAALAGAAAEGLEQVLARARKPVRAPAPAFAAGASASVLFLLRCVGAAGDAEAVASAEAQLSAATAAYLDKRSGRTTGRVLRDAASRHAFAARAVLGAAAARVGGEAAARSEFSRAEAAALAAAAARVLPAVDAPAAAAAADSALAALLSDSFSNAKHRAAALSDGRTAAAALLKAGAELPALRAAADGALAEAEDKGNGLSNKLRAALKLIARTAGAAGAQPAKKQAKRKPGGGKPATPARKKAKALKK